MRVFARTAPQNVVGSLALQEIWQLEWLFAIVEELVQRNFKGTSKFLKRLDSRNGMAVFDTRDIAAEQTSLFLNVTLRKLLFLAQYTQTLSNNQGLILRRV